LIKPHFAVFILNEQAKQFSIALNVSAHGKPLPPEDQRGSTQRSSRPDMTLERSNPFCVAQLLPARL